MGGYKLGSYTIVHIVMNPLKDFKIRGHRMLPSTDLEMALFGNYLSGTTTTTNDNLVYTNTRDYMTKNSIGNSNNTKLRKGGLLSKPPRLVE